MTKKRFLLRLDPRLYDAVSRWAADELRSVNAQMEYILAEAVRRAGKGHTGSGDSPDEDEDDEHGDAPGDDGSDLASRAS